MKRRSIETITKEENRRNESQSRVEQWTTEKSRDARGISIGSRVEQKQKRKSEKSKGEQQIRAKESR
jgi:hypothetical protein